MTGARANTCLAIVVIRQRDENAREGRDQEQPGEPSCHRPDLLLAQDRGQWKPAEPRRGQAGDGSVLFRVAEDGPGVQPEDREAIFEPGQRRPSEQQPWAVATAAVGDSASRFRAGWRGPPAGTSSSATRDLAPALSRDCHLPKAPHSERERGSVQGNSEADDGTRTHDLLHGKQTL